MGVGILNMQVYAEMKTNVKDAVVALVWFPDCVLQTELCIFAGLLGEVELGIGGFRLQL
jgi:hypothetical protein